MSGPEVQSCVEILRGNHLQWPEKIGKGPSERGCILSGASTCAHVREFLDDLRSGVGANDT